MKFVSFKEYDHVLFTLWHCLIDVTSSLQNIRLKAFAFHLSLMPLIWWISVVLQGDSKGETSPSSSFYSLDPSVHHYWEYCCLLPVNPWAFCTYSPYSPHLHSTAPPATTMALRRITSVKHPGTIQHERCYILKQVTLRSNTVRKQDIKLP